MQDDVRPVRWLRIAALCAVLAGAGLAGCSRGQAPRPAATQVLAIQVGSADGANSALPAQIQARYSGDLSFRVAGKLIARAVHVGDRVKKGQILARLDDSDATASLNAARAGQQSAAHKLLYAGQQLQRDQAQFAQDLIAKAQFEQTQDNYTAAQAGQREAQAQLQQAQNNLGYQVLRAEHDGLITAESGEVGTTVAAGQTVYSLAWTPELDAWVDVGAGALSAWQPGKRVQVRATELPGVPFTATVREIAGQEDSQSGSYRVKLTLAGASDRLKPGMTATVMQSGGDGHDGVRIPVGALFHQGERPAVWVIDARTSQLVLRPVSVADYLADAVIVRQGLAPGEWVVAAGVHNVHAGEKVKPATAPDTIFDSGRARTQS